MTCDTFSLQSSELQNVYSQYIEVHSRQYIHVTENYFDFCYSNLNKDGDAVSRFQRFQT